MYAIFSIDFQNNPFRMNVFNSFLAELRREDKLHGENVLPMQGCYNGQREHSFICTMKDFNEYFRDSVFLKGQESILRVASGNKMETSLEYLADGRIESRGCMHQVCKDEAMASDNWTYRPDLGVYWIAKKGNPDGAYRRSQDAHQQAVALAAE